MQGVRSRAERRGKPAKRIAPSPQVGYGDITTKTMPELVMSIFMMVTRCSLL